MSFSSQWLLWLRGTASRACRLTVWLSGSRALTQKLWLMGLIAQWRVRSSWIKPVSPASPAQAGRFFTTEPPGKPLPNVLTIELLICNMLPENQWLRVAAIDHSSCRVQAEWERSGLGWAWLGQVPRVDVLRWGPNKLGLYLTLSVWGSRSVAQVSQPSWTSGLPGTCVSQHNGRGTREQSMRPLNARLGVPTGTLARIAIHLNKTDDRVQIKGWEGTLCPWWSYGIVVDGGKAEEWEPVMPPNTPRNTEQSHMRNTKKTKNKRKAHKWHCAGYKRLISCVSLCLAFSFSHVSLLVWHLSVSFLFFSVPLALMCFSWVLLAFSSIILALLYLLLNKKIFLF